MKPTTLFGVVFLLLAPLMALNAAEAKPAPPNIVVFLVDDMGVMDTSLPFLTDASGKPKRYPLNDFYRTPNMVRLAKRGIRFNNFYAMSVCSPTRVSLMTGQNAARHHTTNWINPSRNNRGSFGPPRWNWKGLTLDACRTRPRSRSSRSGGPCTWHTCSGPTFPSRQRRNLRRLKAAVQIPRKSELGAIASDDLPLIDEAREPNQCLREVRRFRGRIVPANQRIIQPMPRCVSSTVSYFNRVVFRYVSKYVSVDATFPPGGAQCDDIPSNC